MVANRDAVTVLGYVLVEYNQASRVPLIASGEYMYDTVAEAATEMDRAVAGTAEVGRRETYAVARVELIEED